MSLCAAGAMPPIAVANIPFASISWQKPFSNFFCNSSHRSSQSQATKLSSKLQLLQRDTRSLFRDAVPQAIDLAAEAGNFGSAPTLKTLTGRWKKDKNASDSMTEACELIQLPWVLRQALAILSTLDIEDTDDYFKTVMKAGGLMDVVERYSWSGEIVSHPRRDKRRGKHHARVHRHETEDGELAPVIEATWGEPLGGWCSDTFLLSQDGKTLKQVTEMKITESGKSCKYTTVFHRVEKK
ncbi:hypothetical protein Ndes2526B_g00887 [Nannochloris sp. 'desiccata']